MAKKDHRRKKKESNLPAPAAPDFNPRLHYGLLGGIVLLGFMLRYVNMGLISFWGDELYHVFAALNVAQGGEPLLPAGQAFDAAYFFTFLISLVDRVFGASEVTNRMVPVFFGVLTIPLTYLLGRSLFKDRRIGLLAALFIAFIPWYIIRSHVLRMYTSFQVFYLIAVYLFYKGFECTQPLKSESAPPLIQKLLDFCSRENIHPVYLPVSVVFFYISLQIQGFAFEAGPSIMVYALVLFIIGIRKYGFAAVKAGKYGVIVYVAVLGLVFSPLIFKYLYYNPFSKFVPGFDYWLDRFTNHTFWAFKSYLSDARFLHPWIWVMALAGMVGVFVNFNKAKFYLFCLFTVPFVLQSFLFNNPNAVKAHYLFFIFPFFLIFAASGFVTVAEQIVSRVLVNIPDRTAAARIVLVVIVAGVSIPAANRSYATVFEKRHGDQKDRATERFANWREASEYVKARRKPGEAVITTQPWSVLYYMAKKGERVHEPFSRMEDLYHIRMGFNKEMYLREKYREFPNYRKNPNRPVWPLQDQTTGAPILKDYNFFRFAIAQHPRGWIIACHKFFNQAFVDKRVMDMVRKQMKVRFVDRDKTIWVIQYDFSGMQQQPMFEAGSQEQSYPFRLPDPRRLPGDLSIQLDFAGDTAALGNITVNGRGPLPFRYKGTDRRQTVEAVLEKEWLQAGENIVRCSAGGPAAQIFNIGFTLQRGYIYTSL